MIVNLASTSANASRTPYGVSKLAVRGLTSAFAAEFAPDKIRVNAISPGFVGSSGGLVTRAREDLVAILTAQGSFLPPEVLDKCSTDDLAKLIRSLQLLDREGTMEDVVKTLLFLCSDDAGFITGETVRISGGAAVAF